MAYEPYKIEERVLNPQAVASIRAWISMEEIPVVMGRTFQQVASVLAAQGVAPAGPPFAYYHSWSPEAGEIELGWPVNSEFEERDGVVHSQLPGGRVLVTTHVGRYEDLEPAYNAMMAHAAHNGLELAVAMWECYLTDPAETPDEAKHVTMIYWPIVGETESTL